MRQIVRTPDAPGSPLFSQAVKVGSTIYLSGIVGIDPKTNQLAGATIQARRRDTEPAGFDQDDGRAWGLMNPAKQPPAPRDKCTISSATRPAPGAF